jgi:hypothetical protein
MCSNKNKSECPIATGNPGPCVDKKGRKISCRSCATKLLAAKGLLANAHTPRRRDEVEEMQYLFERRCIIVGLDPQLITFAR